MAVPAGQRALLPVPDAWPLLEVHCVFAVVAVQGPEVVGRLIGSSVVPPSVCDLGLASALTQPQFLHLYNEGWTQQL